MIANIIHFNGRIDRHAQIEHEARVNGLKYRYWPAIKGPTGRAGITMAWKNMVAYAKETEQPYWWGCEDDVKFTHPDAIAYYEANMPKDPDVWMYFGGIWQKKVVGGQLSMWRGMHCVVLFPGIYDKILKMPDDTHIDTWLSRNVNPARIRICDPLVAVCYDGWSDNYEREFSHSGLEGDDFKLFGS